MKKEETKRLNRIITGNSQRFYKKYTEELKYHNWLGKIYSYLAKGRQVYPKPSDVEIEAFKKITGFKGRWEVNRIRKIKK